MSMRCSQPVATEHWTKPDLSQTRATGPWEDQERTCATCPIWNVHPVHKRVGWCPSSRCQAAPLCPLIPRGPWKHCPSCLLFHLVFSPSFFHDYHLDNFYRLLLLAGMLLLLLSCIFPQRNPHSPRTRILWRRAHALCGSRPRHPRAPKGVWFTFPPRNEALLCCQVGSWDSLFKAQIDWDPRRPARGWFRWLQRTTFPGLPPQSRAGPSAVSLPVPSCPEGLGSWVWGVYVNNLEDCFLLFKHC